MGGLFREEALEAKRNERLGTISLATPLGFFWWAFIALALATAAILLLVFGHYTRHERVSGRLVPNAGLLTLSSQTTGIVSRTLVYEGDVVDAGQPLLEERQPWDIKQQLIKLQAQLADVTLKMKAARFRGQLTQLDAELEQRLALKSTVLRAPSSGLVSNLLVKAGQLVASGQPLVSILPKGSKLQAQLFVPSNVVGLLRPGSQVVLRYEAFPYKQFGQQYGKIIHVSYRPLTPFETAALARQRPNTSTPLYEVRVSLDRQELDAFGRVEPLVPGMALSGDISLGRTSLWSWAFDPVRGSYQKLSKNGAHTN